MHEFRSFMEEAGTAVAYNHTCLPRTVSLRCSAESQGGITDVNEVLEQMFETRVVYSGAGEEREFRAGINPRQVALLTRMCRERNVRATVKIGLAYGTSALAILDGMGNQGRHVAVDPHQATDWENIGLLNAHRAGYGPQLEVMELPDDRALPLHLERGDRFDLAFVDGWHTFDSSFIEAYYLDQLLNVGGLMVCHDYAMPGVDRAIAALMAHRPYRVVPEYETVRPWKNRLFAFGKRARNGQLRPSSFSLAPAARASMAVIEKLPGTRSDIPSFYRRF
jgi:predicted O-methyltransferase YrrM